jgi:hypothetical protein
VIQWVVVLHVFSGAVAALVGWWAGNKFYDWWERR